MAFSSTKVTIAVGATNSGWVDLQGYDIVGIVVPSGFTGASLKVDTAPPKADGTADTANAVAVQVAGSDLSISANPGKATILQATAALTGYLSLQHVRFVANTTQLTADATLTLLLKTHD